MVVVGSRLGKWGSEALPAQLWISARQLGPAVGATLLRRAHDGGDEIDGNDGSMRLGISLNPKLYQVIQSQVIINRIFIIYIYIPSYINVINWFTIPSIGSSNWILCYIYIYMHFIPGWWGSVLLFGIMREYGDCHHMFIRTFWALVFCDIYIYIHIILYIYIIYIYYICIYIYYIYITYIYILYIYILYYTVIHV